MSFFDYVKMGWEVIKLKAEAIEKLAAEEKGFGPAIAIIAIGGACGALGTIQAAPLFVVFAVAALVGMFIFTGIVHFAATSFLGGKGEFKPFFVPVGCGALITWATIIPVIGPLLSWLAGIWLLVVSVLVTEKVYGLDRGKAVVAVAIPVVILLIIGSIFGALLLSLFALTR